MRKSRFTADSRARPRTWCSAPPRTRSIVAGGVRGYVLRASLVPVDLHGPTPRSSATTGFAPALCGALVARRRRK
jgi:hypothetical protein